MYQINGAYSLLVMSPRKLIAARDPYGFRPLVMGKINGTYVLPVKPVLLMLAVQNLYAMLSRVKLWLLTKKG